MLSIDDILMDNIFGIAHIILLLLLLKLIIKSDKCLFILSYHVANYLYFCFNTNI